MKGIGGVERAIQRAREVWPELRPCDDLFRNHVDGLSVGAEGIDAHGHELYLTFSCARSDASALAILERQYLVQVGSAIARVDPSHYFVDEVCQTLRERLLLGEKPRIALYAATGPLNAWLKVAALRLALNRKNSVQSRRELPLDALPELARVVGPGNEAYRESVRQALGTAFAALSARQRNLLRLHYVEALSIDQIGVLYDAHRATVARWLVRIREQILDTVKRDVQTRFELTRSEVNSVLAAVRSDLDLSMLRLLDATVPA